MGINLLLIIILGASVILFFYTSLYYQSKSKGLRELQQLIIEMAECNIRKTRFLIDLNKLFQQNGDTKNSDYKKLLEEMNQKGVLEENCTCFVFEKN